MKNFLKHYIRFQYFKLIQKTALPAAFQTKISGYYTHNATMLLWQY